MTESLDSRAQPNSLTAASFLLTIFCKKALTTR